MQGESDAGANLAQYNNSGTTEDASTRLLDRDELSSGPHEEEGQIGDAKSSPAGKVSWPMMTFILLGDMFGLGTLTLPADFARLGWILAVLVMLLCLCGMLYCGRLFTLLAAKVPNARVFDDYGKAAMGKTGQILVYVCVYGTILLTPIILHLTCVESLQQIFYQRNIPPLVAGGVVAGIMLPLAQVQGLEDVAVLSVLGSVGMLLSVIIATIKLVLMESEVKHTELIHKPDTFSTPIVAILDIVFTYGGQVNWVRYLTQMKVRSHFPRSVIVTGLAMTCVYILMGTVGYIRLGTGVDATRPITSVVPQDRVLTPIMNAGLFVHCVLAYQINLNVWSDIVLHLIRPVTQWPDTRLQSPGWFAWGLVSICGILISFAIAAVFPFFSTVAAIIASLGDLSGAYALPAIFLLTLAGTSLGKWEKGVLRGIIPLTILMSAVGLVCSVYSLVLQFLQK